MLGRLRRYRLAAMLSRAVRGRRLLTLRLSTRVRQVPLSPDSMRPRWRDGRSLRQYGRPRCAAHSCTATTTKSRRMPCQAQEHSGGRTASRPHLTIAAAIEAAIVGVAGRGRQPHRCAPRCDKLLEARMWTEIPISARRGVIVHRQRLLDWLPLRVTHICAMVYSCTSLYIEEARQRVRPLLQHAPYLPRSTA